MNPNSTPISGVLTAAALALIGSIAVAMLLDRVSLAPAAAAAQDPRAPQQVRDAQKMFVFLLFFAPTIAAAPLISGIAATAKRWPRCLEITAIGILIASMPFGLFTIVGIGLLAPLERFEPQHWARVAGQVFFFAIPLLVCPFAALVGLRVGNLGKAADCDEVSREV